MGVHSSGCAQWLWVCMVSVGVHSGGCTAQWVCTVAVGVHGAGGVCVQCLWVCTVVGVHRVWCAQWLHFGRYAQWVCTVVAVHSVWLCITVSVGVHGACG